jgi:O-antigen/teichoic acid export membrane protein
VNQTPASPKSNLIRGAVWTVGTRWLIKGMGFINTVIMARLLMPEDYGIVAMGMLMVGFIETFVDFSAAVALLRKKEISRDEIDSAWTLQLIQGVLTGLLVALAAPLAVRYFSEPRLLEVLWIFAACVVFAGARNVAQTLALREFDFSVDFRITSLGKLASVIVTIAFGFLFRDYRALALGIVAGYLVPLWLSYAIHPYRPCWNTSRIPEIWHLTKWLLISNIGGFLMRKCDELAAGKIGTTTEFGLYNVGSDFGQLPVSEVGPAMQRAILPVLASIKEERERTRQAVLKTLSAIATVIWPIACGFSAIALDATRLVFGDKWLDASPYVAVFVLTAALRSNGGPLRAFLTLIGQTRVQSAITWLEFFSFAGIAALLVPGCHLLGLAYARVASSLLSLLFLVAAAHRHCHLPWTAIFFNCYLPIVISAIMYFLVNAISEAFDIIAMRLVTGIFAGTVFYISFIWMTWLASGRPEGLESTVMDRIKGLSGTI